MNKRKLARFIQRFPWSIGLSIALWRRVAGPWVTMGTVGAVFNEQHEMLLVEHVFHPEQPWGMPGGWMNRHEEPERTIVREVKEETGLDIVVEKTLLIIKSAYLPRHLDVAFLCRALPGTVRLSDELLDFRWIDPRQPPPLDLFCERVLAAALAEQSHGQTTQSVETV